MPNENKRYYWLKLRRDFFKRHDIRIIEEMPNGKDYVLFYLKLLLESIDHDGNLRFSETISYNEQMLSIITNTNIDIVKSAMTIFNELKMIEILDDRTIYMNEVNKLIGSETSVAERVRRHRENNKMLQCNTNVTKSNTDIDIDIELDKDKDKDIDKEKEKNKYYYEKEKIKETSFSQKLILKLFQSQYIDKLEDYDSYVEAIDELTKNYKEDEIDRTIDEILEKKKYQYMSSKERLDYFKKSMNNESKKDDDDILDGLPF